MPDMLVKLYNLPDMVDIDKRMKEEGIDIRRVIASEKHIIVDWVRQTFNQAWASECEVSFSNHPVSCYVAVENGNIIGFACYDATYRDFFGPTGVDNTARGRGAGKALLLKCLYDMEAQGYGYAIVGGVGPEEFYAKNAKATVIEDSTPGIYQGALWKKK
ncbi:MAG: GNAT family N-acetyltransferase [Ruminiclostridium sp.]